MLTQKQETLEAVILSEHTITQETIDWLSRETDSSGARAL